MFSSLCVLMTLSAIRSNDPANPVHSIYVAT